MNEKRLHLTFDKGISNYPSDIICDDNTLEESVGMVYDGYEHRVVQRPVKNRNANGKLLFVHKIPGGNTENDITVYNAKICSNGTEICEAGTKNQVKAIGNTLIINTDGNISYALWQNGAYKYLGSTLPDVELRFRMGDGTRELVYESGSWRRRKKADDSLAITFTDDVVALSSGSDGVIDGHVEYPSYQDVSTWYTHWEINTNKQSEFNDAMRGIVSSHLNDIKKKLKEFCYPFFVRYAIKMYDGSYANISNPILMIPTKMYNRMCYFCEGNMTLIESPAGNAEVISATFDPYHSKMFCDVVAGIDSGWKDLIRGVDVFVTDEVKQFDMNNDWGIINDPHWTGMSQSDMESYIIYDEETNSSYSLWDFRQTNALARHTAFVYPTMLSEDVFKQRLLSSLSVFRKLFEIDINDVIAGRHIDTSEVIDGDKLLALDTQIQLEHDSYLPAKRSANIMKVYNGRLHLADITQAFFNGYRHFSSAKMDGFSQMKRIIIVHMNTDNGEVIVRRELPVGFSDEDIAYWMYYPDTRACAMDIYTIFNSTILHRYVEMKKSDTLNGAYALPYGHGLSAGQTITDESEIPNPEDNIEHIGNRVFVSEVNNPWVVNAVGDVSVGNSIIIGMATQTVALGQEEHGTHPMTVFTKDGIYGLRLNSQGIYMSADMFSREVCNNPKSITETDGSVFFSSEKGLMVVVGSKVDCVSEQLNGRDGNLALNEIGKFSEFLKKCEIAYDYRDSMLWITDNAHSLCWVYSIKGGTFGKFDLGKVMRSRFVEKDGQIVRIDEEVPFTIDGIVNDYPDMLLQVGSAIYSLAQRPNINDDDRQYNGTMVTRPMKLEDAITLKTITQLKHIHSILHGQLKFRIWASNDLKNWAELKSLHGQPWKFYRFEYTFENIKAADTFAGTVVEIQERRTRKLR